MKISDYPYGKITKTLKKAVEWFNRNGRRVIRDYEKSHGIKILTRRERDIWFDGLAVGFDYPDYFYMPKTISSRLNSDEVDFLQGEWANTVFEHLDKAYGA